MVFCTNSDGLNNIVALMMAFGKVFSVDKSKINSRLDAIYNYLMENIVIASMQKEEGMMMKIYP
jgi:flagellin-specific chaperone FliS